MPGNETASTLKSTCDGNELLEHIKENFFLRHNLAQMDGNGEVFEAHRQESATTATLYQPNHDGKNLLSKYYHDKYGLLIINIATVNDAKNVINFVSKNKENFKIFDKNKIEFKSNKK